MRCGAGGGPSTWARPAPTHAEAAAPPLAAPPGEGEVDAGRILVDRLPKVPMQSWKCRILVDRLSVFSGQQMASLAKLSEQLVPVPCQVSARKVAWGPPEVPFSIYSFHHSP